MLYSVFSDEDMQSLASLMSLKQSDIGNLDDFNDSDEEEDRRLSAAVKNATAVIGNVDMLAQTFGNKFRNRHFLF